MRTAQGRVNGRRRRTFRLECLEGRELLSVARPAALVAHVAHAAGPVAQTVHVTPRIVLQPSFVMGHVVGLPATAGEFYTPPPAFTSYSGHGRSSPLGVIVFGNQHVAIPNAAGTALTLTKGTALITAAPLGEFIDVGYTGTATILPSGRAVFTLKGTITGGTGRFDGATGTFSATGVATKAGRLTLDFQLSPKYPRTV